MSYSTFLYSTHVKAYSKARSLSVSVRLLCVICIVAAAAACAVYVGLMHFITHYRLCVHCLWLWKEGKNSTIPVLHYVLALRPLGRS